jgi:hypothetical protein
MGSDKNISIFEEIMNQWLEYRGFRFMVEVDSRQKEYYSSGYINLLIEAVYTDDVEEVKFKNYVSQYQRDTKYDIINRIYKELDSILVEITTAINNRRQVRLYHKLLIRIGLMYCNIIDLLFNILIKISMINKIRSSINNYIARHNLYHDYNGMVNDFEQTNASFSYYTPKKELW